MLRIILLLPVLCFCLYSYAETMESLIKRVFEVSEKQYTAMNSRLDSVSLPRSISSDGKFMTAGIRWWCSGFYPGSLWYIYEYTGNDEVRKLAEYNTSKLEPLKYITTDHDIGFQLNCSYGNGFRLTDNQLYKKVLCKGAESLATRFNSVAGVIRSWDFVMDGRDWKYPVIIDNMMNLELLMLGSRLSGNILLEDIAKKHADTTIKNHFRDNFTTWHLVDYDTVTGAVRKKETVQGLSDESAWSRGQAWALYGFTMMFKTTGDYKYLYIAEKIGNMLIEKLPDDGIPYWDFDDEGSIKDSSAAAIMAAAFIDLSRLTKDIYKEECFLEMAEKQLRCLASSKYLAAPGTNCNFILKHGVGNLPDNSEIDAPLSYGDYYFLEALLKYRSIYN